MFAIDMLERQTNKLIVKELDPSTIPLLLIFMYTDVIDENKITTKLLETANYYQVLRLKDICEKKLAIELRVENVVEVWLASHLHNSNKLERSAVNFIVKHIKLIRDTQIFLDVAESYSDLWKDVIKGFDWHVSIIQRFGPLRLFCMITDIDVCDIMNAVIIRAKPIRKIVYLQIQYAMLGLFQNQ